MEQRDFNRRGPLMWLADFFDRERAVAIFLIALLTLGASLSFGLSLWMAGVLPPWFYPIF